jgi:hypothetical protein
MEGPFGDGDLGLALIRDGNGARAFDTLLRYRASAQAELHRTLRTLRALQAETRAQEAAPAPLPNQPEPRSNPGDSRAAAMPAPGCATAAEAAPAPEPAPLRQANGPLHSNRANPKAAEILAPARLQRPAAVVSARAGAGST